MANDMSDRQRLFFEPCATKEALRLWIKVFLSIELPDETVDEESTSNPLEFVWQVYVSMQTKTGPKRHVAACGRNTGKTLTACIIRFLGMVHFRRSGIHVAADLNQSASATMYLEKFLMIPEIAPFMNKANTRIKELINLPPNSFTSATTCNVRIATATIKGVNSQRGSLNTRDEVDLVPREILAEAAWIADPTPEGLPPVELNLSSRKSNSGPIQKLIDEAEGGDKSIVLHKWSIVDWMRPCPPELHRPDLGRQTVWVNTENLKLTWGHEAAGLLSDVEKQIQKQYDAFVGCRKCPACIVCLGRSVGRKSLRGRLRDEQFVGDRMKEVSDPANIIAQGLNWRPESSAVVFREFSRRRHFFKPIEFYKWVTGEYFVPPDADPAEVVEILKGDDEFAKMFLSPTKRQIYEAMRARGWKIHYGIDWGSTDPAVCIVVGYHKSTRRLVVLHVEGMTGFPNEDWAKYVDKSIWPLYPGDLICPDMEDPNSPIYFGRLRLPCRDVKPRLISPGVSQIRSFMFNPMTQESHFAMLDDGDMGMAKWVAECFEKWTFAKTLISYDFSHFEDNQYTHPCFVPGTLVSTKTGVKPIEDVLVGDEVLVRTGEFQKVTAIMSRNYDGEIVGVTPFGAPTTWSTPNHPFWVGKAQRSYKRLEGGRKLSGQLVFSGERGWVLAGELSKTRKNAKTKYFVTCRMSSGSSKIIIDSRKLLPNWVEHDGRLYPTAGRYRKCPALTKHSVPLSFEVTPDLAFVLGYWVAEGSRNRKRKSINFSGHKREKNVRGLIDHVMSQLDGNKSCWCDSKKDNGRRIYLNSALIYALTADLGQMDKKRFPDWSIEATDGVRLGLVMGYLFGDGNFTEGKARCNGISPDVLFMIRNLLISLGFPPSINFLNRKSRWGVKKDQYSVALDIENTNRLLSILPPSWRSVFEDKAVLTKKAVMPSTKQRINGQEWIALIRKTETRIYNGRVYNLEVGSDHSYVVNGVSVSNCDALRYAADPWILDATVSMRSSQPKTEQQETIAAKMGDPSAAEKAKLREDVQKQMRDHFEQEFGMTGVFSQQTKIEKAGLTPEQQRGWTPLAPNKDQFVEKTKDPNEKLENKPKPAVRFCF